MYSNCVKRVIDFIVSLAALVILAPLFLFLTALGAIKMKGDPFFVQPRPGKDEKIFGLLKFRSMTEEKGADGRLLSDAERLTGYGKAIRSLSLDELPQLVNIILGHMALVGPRPLLVRDMVFMTEEQRKRHSVRPGLTGLAQATGRNAIAWPDKLATDLRYIQNISFHKDLSIVFMTVGRVLEREGIAEEGLATTADFGDYLLGTGQISREEYDAKQAEALKILEKSGWR